MDFLLTAKRDKRAARRFLIKAIEGFGKATEINIDKSGANLAALERQNKCKRTRFEIRQVKYLNNIVEQDHRAVKRITRHMMGFKSLWSAANTLAGIELVHMLRKNQMAGYPGLALHQKFEILAA